MRTTEVSESDPFLGTTLVGKYQLTELIGVGAMGRVYRANHLSLDAQVAVKLLNPDIAADPVTAKRFQTEARAASRLHHPNAIAILDFGQAESGALFLAMELLRGRSLARILHDEGKLEFRRIVDLLGQALSALDEAHAAGIVHRDFKPENLSVELLRSGREHVKVLDFGIAKLRDAEDSNVTSRGLVCGTPDYMSPEQIRGEELDARSDVYAAGVVLYEMITCARPFVAAGPVINVLMAHLQKAVPDLRKHRPDVPTALVDVCLRALDKNRDRRFSSASELKAALDAAVEGLTVERCHKCSAVVPASARFCLECGAVLRAEKTGTPLSFTSDLASLETERELQTTGPPPKLPLCGREPILAQLDGLGCEALLLHGEAGVGKSALVAEWAHRLEERGRHALFVRPDPSLAKVPWLPIVRAIAELLALGDRPSEVEIDRALEDHPQDRVGLYELFELGGAASALPLDARRRECLAAVIGCLRRFSGAIIFEDLDQYDAPSLDLVAELVRHPGQCTALFTARDPEAFPQAVKVSRCLVPPLLPSAFASLSLSRAAIEASHGNPLELIERLSAEASGLGDSSPSARLAALSPPARALLEAAIVGGSDVPNVALAQVAEVSDPGPALGELVATGWLAEGARRLELSSLSQRQRLYENLSEERRRGLHARMASLLLGLGSDPIAIAHHAFLAAQPSLALFERAGDTARERFDDQAAEQWYGAALEQARRSNAAPTLVLRLSLKLGPVCRYRNDFVTSGAVLSEALSLAVQGGDRWGEVQARRGLARLAMAQSNLADAEKHLLAGVPQTLSGRDRTMLSELYLDLAEVLTRKGDEASAEREVWEGVMLCSGGEGPEAQKGPDPLWRMILLLGQWALLRQEIPAAISLGTHALRHAATVRSTLGTARTHAFLADCEASLGRGDRAAHCRRLSADEIRETGDRRSTAELLVKLAVTAPGVEARGYLREADALAQQIGWHEGITRARNALAKHA